MPQVELRKITPENFEECVNLKVGKGQETFVASNARSIAQSKVVYPRANTAAVYAGDEMVGFAMYGCDEDDGRFYLGRLMIDEKHQRKGYGRAATLEVIERMKNTPDCDALYLSFAPENTGAEKLYLSVGFEKTGEMNGNEIIMRFDLKANNQQRTTDN